MASTDTVTFDELLGRLQAEGFAAFRQSPAGTPRACGVFYPGSKGDGP